MPNYHVYLITDQGEGRVQRLADWNGEDVLQLNCATFANDVVISIEPAPSDENTEE